MKPLALLLFLLPLTAEAQWPTHCLHLHDPDVMEVRAAVNQDHLHTGVSHSLLKKLRLQYSADFMPNADGFPPPFLKGRGTAVYLLGAFPGLYLETGITYHFGGGAASKRFYHVGMGVGNYNPGFASQVWLQTGVAFQGKIIDFGGTLKPHFIRREQQSEIMLDILMTAHLKWRGIRPFVQGGIGMGHGYPWFFPPRFMLSLGMECKIKVKRA